MPLARTPNYGPRAARAIVDARAQNLGPRIATLLNGYRLAVQRQDRRVVRKAAETGNPEDTFLERLERLLGGARRRVALEHGQRALRLSGLPEVRATDMIQVEPLRVLLEGTQGTARDILQETQRQIDATIQRVLREAAQATPRPTDSATARRLRQELAALAEMTQERAMRIARTEMGVASNTGLAAGYEAAGAKELEWLAFRDGRSGDRHHERMHGQRVAVGELFTLPSGAKMRYPLDPRGPVGEIVNCRCTVRARRRAD